ncbi:Uncharacterised protein [uncultured archaeon]|nr:Uncharacterised protein [uncultured archaeon]
MQKHASKPALDIRSISASQRARMEKNLQIEIIRPIRKFFQDSALGRKKPENDAEKMRMEKNREAIVNTLMRSFGAAKKYDVFIGDFTKRRDSLGFRTGPPDTVLEALKKFYEGKNYGAIRLEAGRIAINCIKNKELGNFTVNCDQAAATETGLFLSGYSSYRIWSKFKVMAEKLHEKLQEKEKIPEIKPAPAAQEKAPEPRPAEEKPAKEATEIEKVAVPAEKETVAPPPAQEKAQQPSVETPAEEEEGITPSRTLMEARMEEEQAERKTRGSFARSRALRWGAPIVAVALVASFAGYYTYKNFWKPGPAPQKIVRKAEPAKPEGKGEAAKPRKAEPVTPPVEPAAAPKKEAKKEAPAAAPKVAQGVRRAEQKTRAISKMARVREEITLPLAGEKRLLEGKFREQFSRKSAKHPEYAPVYEYINSKFSEKDDVQNGIFESALEDVQRGKKPEEILRKLRNTWETAPAEYRK